MKMQVCMLFVCVCACVSIVQIATWILTNNGAVNHNGPAVFDQQKAARLGITLPCMQIAGGTVLCTYTS